MNRQPSLRRRRPGLAARTFTQAMLVVPLVAILGFAGWVLFLAPSPDQRQLDRFGLKTGDRLPYVQVGGASDGIGTLGEMADAGPLLVLVSDEECPVCHRELENVQKMRPEAGSAVRLVVLSVSQEALHGRLASKYPGLTVVTDVNGTLRERLNLPSVPAVLAIGPDRRVREIRFGLQSMPELRASIAALQSPSPTVARTPAP